jgi:hypothetical protein
MPNRSSAIPKLLQPVSSAEADAVWIILQNQPSPVLQCCSCNCCCCCCTDATSSDPSKQAAAVNATAFTACCRALLPGATASALHSCLCTLSADAACQLNVLGHDCHTAARKTDIEERVRQRPCNRYVATCAVLHAMRRHFQHAACFQANVTSLLARYHPCAASQTRSGTVIQCTSIVCERLPHRLSAPCASARIVAQSATAPKREGR